jgi:hypothetical protein
METVQTQQGETNMKTATQAASSSPVLNGVKVAGETLVVPGASLLLDGNVKDGTTHIVAAFVARALLGPLGWAYVAADSFSKSVSGKHLHQQFIGG